MTIEDALDYLDNICVCYGCECWQDHDWGGCYRTTTTGKMACDLRDEAVEVLRKVVFRSKGRWINVTTKAWVPDFQCSECGEKYVYQHNFCPNCGADMRGSDERFD